MSRLYTMVWVFLAALVGHGALAETITHERTTAKDSVAVCVEGDVAAADLAVTVNGTAIEQTPYETKEGLWYQIGSGALVVGTNTITVEQLNGAPAAITLRVRELTSGAEEAHFPLVVGPVTQAQPAVDANQLLMDVQHVDLDLTLDPTASVFTAAVMTMTAESLDNSLSQCVLDLNDNGGALVVSAVDDGFGSGLTFTHNGAQDRLFITLPAAVPSGNTFTVRVFYSGDPLVSGNRGYQRGTHSGNPVLYTHNQPYAARTWFPCKDIPADKFTIDMHVTVPTTLYGGFELYPVCNGALTSVDDNGGTKTYHWSEGYDIATQYVSIACSNYQIASGEYTALDTVTTMKVGHAVYPENFAAESPELPRTIEVMEHFADLFGEYPFLTEKYYTATWAINFGLEHQTNTSMPVNNLNNPPYHRRNVHELAHMWFGCATGVEVMDHLWLSEGWATYCEALWKEHKNGIAEYHSEMAGRESSSSDFRTVVHPDADDFNLSVTYYKGAWVLHMLRHVIGDTDFFQATQNYLADANLRYGTVTSDDFQTHVEAVTATDLDHFFDEWLNRASRPDYDWFWTSSTSGPDTIIHLGLEQVQADLPYTMPIDFRVTFSDASPVNFTVFNDQATQNFDVNVGPGTPTSVAFDPDNWLLDFNTEISAPGVPDPPTLLSAVTNGAAGSVTLTWVAGLGATGHRLYQSADGMAGWTLIADESVLTSGVTQRVVTGFSANDEAHFYLTGFASSEGDPSDVLSVRLGTGGAALLIVDGYDRWDTQTALNPTGANHDFVADHGRAVSAHGTSFDSCANEVVGGTVDLTDYEIVVWMCGDESTVDETFSDAEQDLVETFLEGGGKLLVSGNEIGWDLGRGSQPASDQAFYNNYLKADYAADDSNDYTLNATGGNSAFGVSNYTFGNGGDSPYLPGFPDVITTSGGSEMAMHYSVGNLAGVQYAGTFGASGTPGMLITLGFSFETVYPEASRLQLMDEALSWFGAPIPAGLVLFGEAEK